MPTAKEKKISEKSTKQELWSAYNEVVAQIGGEKIEVAEDDTVNEMIRKLSETKIKINSEFDELTKALLSDLSDLYKTSESIRQNKLELLDRFDKQKKLLSSEIEEVRNRWRTEEIKLGNDFKQRTNDLDTEHKRREEEYIYNLKITRQKETDDYNAMKERREKAITEQENIISERKKEITEMEKQIADMPALIESKIKSAEEVLTKELTAKYQIQIKDVATDKEHQAKISEIKIGNLESTLKSQNDEIAALKSQLQKANEMIKDMATTAIESKKPLILNSKSQDLEK